MRMQDVRREAGELARASTLGMYAHVGIREPAEPGGIRRQGK